MNPERLFLERYRALVEGANSNREIELLDLAGIIRQLIADKNSLVDSVNKNRLPLTFVAGQLPSVSGPPDAVDVFYTIEDGIDPDTAFRPKPATLSKDQFLAHPIAMSFGNTVTIKDVIKYAANAAGGVHHDPNPRPEYHAVHRASQMIRIGGLPFGIRTLKAIGRVTIRALKPLADDVEKRLTSPPASLGR